MLREKSGAFSLPDGHGAVRPLWMLARAGARMDHDGVRSPGAGALAAARARPRRSGNRGGAHARPPDADSGTAAKAVVEGRPAGRGGAARPRWRVPWAPTVVAAADDRIPVYAASPPASCRARRVTQQDVRRVDVQLGDDLGGYLSADLDLGPPAPSSCARCGRASCVPPRRSARGPMSRVQPLTVRGGRHRSAAPAGRRVDRRRLRQPARPRRSTTGATAGADLASRRRPVARVPEVEHAVWAASRGTTGGAGRWCRTPTSSDLIGQVDLGARLTLVPVPGSPRAGDREPHGPHGGQPTAGRPGWSPPSSASDRARRSCAAAPTSPTCSPRPRRGWPRRHRVGRPALARPRGPAPPGQPSVGLRVLPPGDEAAERHLRQLGIEAVVPRTPTGPAAGHSRRPHRARAACRSDPAGPTTRCAGRRAASPPHRTRSRAVRRAPADGGRRGTPGRGGRGGAGPRSSPTRG